MADNSGARGSGSQVIFFLLLLLIGFIVVLLTSGSRGAGTGSPLPASVFQTGSVSAEQQQVLAQLAGNAAPRTGAGGSFIGCQPGIRIGVQLDVVYAAVRLRRTPGYVGKDDAQDTILILEPGDRLVVIDGPYIVDGLCWWLVDFQGTQGWAADHGQGGQLLLVDP